MKRFQRVPTLLWRETERSPAPPVHKTEKAKPGGRKPRIRCPKCGYQPKASDRWVCSNTIGSGPNSGMCGHVWNTFDTRGKCPSCRFQWQVTACLSCHEWSAHEDWYEDRPTE